MPKSFEDYIDLKEEDFNLLLNQTDSMLKNIQGQISNLNKELKFKKKILVESEKIKDLFKQKLFASTVKTEIYFHKIIDPNSNTDISNEMNKIFQYSKESCEKIARMFPSIIQDRCLSEKIPLDQTSRHPNYNFCQNFITLKVNDNEFEAKGYTRGSARYVFSRPFDIELIIQEIKNEIKRLFKRPFDKQKFTENLYQQYQAILKKNKGNIGDQIHIQKVINNLRENNKEAFKIDEFIIDLSKLLEEGPPI
ncbi:hypothetical protein LCGC14_3015620, partial [marine sediment metagenome]